MQKLTSLFFSFLIVQISFAQKGNELIKVTDMLKIKTVGAVTLSTDGNKAAFIVTSIEPDDTKTDYRYVTQIHMINTDGGSSPKQLTSSKDGSSQPVWSPDGKQLAFVRTVDSKPQIFLLPIDGGEAMQLTRSKYGASNPKWSPDGKQIIYASGITLADLLKDSVLNPKHAIPAWSLEKPGFSKNEYLKISAAKPNPDGNMEEIRSYLAKDEIDKKAKVFTKLNFQDEANVSSETNFTQYFIINASTQDSTKPKSITKGFYRFNNIDFTPDGKQLIISGYVDSTQTPDRALENQILIANADGSNLHPLLSKQNTNYNNAKLSPSGKWLAFQYGSTGFVEVPQLAIMPLNGSLKDIITIPFDRNKGNITWSNDEKYIYFSAQSNGGQPLYRVNVTTKNIEQLSDYNSGILSFDVAGSKIVFSKTEVINPSELYVADASMKSVKLVSNFNGWVKEKKLSVPEKKTFVNSKGLTVEYWVMKPTNYSAGKKYPLLLEIHGGPAAMWGPGEASMWHEYQFFCSKGYGVVYSNPRGSGGYGKEFLRANINDWGSGPSSDVLTALDKTVAEGWADTSKLVVTGGSYAGYLVAWIISHDQRFKAACSQRGVYDLATFFGEGNAWRLVPNYFGGYPWDPEVNATLVRESPITYVKNITTPYIIFHGENDRRTGFVQSEMLYRSLKVLGRPVEYVRHPGATHELTRSGDNRQRIDQMLRTYEFFERYLGK
ncbi:MAG: S9 family peptidase [Chitinophagaceae bacterium]|nr:S9 family peptidase [Chitinophagaceae bacterium]